VIRKRSTDPSKPAEGVGKGLPIQQSIWVEIVKVGCALLPVTTDL